MPVVKVCWLAALAASGCNWFYDIQKSRPLDAAIPIDAQYFDAPPDAPPACPPPGSAPAFQPGYFQLPVGNCISYVPAPDSGDAVTYCFTGAKSGVSQGPIDQMVAEAQLTPPPPPSGGTYYMPRVSADGTVLFVENTGTGNVDIFHRNTDGSWAFANQTLVDASYRFISNATRGPVRRAIQTDLDGVNMTYRFFELEEQPSGAWLPIDEHVVGDIGMGYIDTVSLSPDGLHMTFVGIIKDGTKTSVYWTQRPDIASDFGQVVELTTVPQGGIQTPYVTEDCSRVYFSALSTVFYQKLQ